MDTNMSNLTPEEISLKIESLTKKSLTFTTLQPYKDVMGMLKNFYYSANWQGRYLLYLYLIK